MILLPAMATLFMSPLGGDRSGGGGRLTGIQAYLGIGLLPDHHNQANIAIK